MWWCSGSRQTWSVFFFFWLFFIWYSGLTEDLKLLIKSVQLLAARTVQDLYKVIIYKKLEYFIKFSQLQSVQFKTGQLLLHSKFKHQPFSHLSLLFTTDLSWITNTRISYFFFFSYYISNEIYETHTKNLKGICKCCQGFAPAYLKL